MSILVTGGAGYIGSHVTRLLQDRGTEVVVVDNLTSGSKSRISGVELIELELSAPEATSVLIEAMTKHQVSGVIHFAAQKQVGVSMTDPEYYYEQNISGMNNLLKANTERQRVAAEMITSLAKTAASAYTGGLAGGGGGGISGGGNHSQDGAKINYFDKTAGQGAPGAAAGSGGAPAGTVTGDAKRTSRLPRCW